jgi:hypothetical protein
MNTNLGEEDSKKEPFDADIYDECIDDNHKGFIDDYNSIKGNCKEEIKQRLIKFDIIKKIKKKYFVMQLDSITIFRSIGIEV